ncbi:hypothetical protein EVG20_g10277 [Dentipellis fragilis]|uniref:SHSP domain-containing protein n=1 Tax=Dentipellis fragilis TaxID=205917 RepID=A0A4Y9XSG5_9AGAM|nr:hypothetical protein EVG20_g10277 [Dentipellis fragilis]
MNHSFTHPYARPTDNPSPRRQSISHSSTHSLSPLRHAEAEQPPPQPEPSQPPPVQEQEPGQYRQLDRALAQRYMELVFARRRRAAQIREGGEPPVMRPRMEICDAPSTPHITALFEIPGLRKDQIHVHLTPEGRLTISGERRAPPLLHNATDPTLPRYPVCEIKYGKYERTVEVPSGLETSAPLLV